MKWVLFLIYSLLTVIFTAVIATKGDELLIWGVALAWTITLVGTIQAIAEDK
jgi:hypothetical protein